MTSKKSINFKEVFVSYEAYLNGRLLKNELEINTVNTYLKNINYIFLGVENIAPKMKNIKIFEKHIEGNENRRTYNLKNSTFRSFIKFYASRYNKECHSLIKKLPGKTVERIDYPDISNTDISSIIRNLKKGSEFDLKSALVVSFLFDTGIISTKALEVQFEEVKDGKFYVDDGVYHRVSQLTLNLLDMLKIKNGYIFCNSYGNKVSSKGLYNWVANVKYKDKVLNTYYLRFNRLRLNWLEGKTIQEIAELMEYGSYFACYRAMFLEGR